MDSNIQEQEDVSKERKLRGSYRFKLEGYSLLSTKIGESVESPEFSLCEHVWQLRIFPGGSLSPHAGFISFYLASKSTRLARASYKLFVKSQLPGALDEVFISSGVRTFEPKGIQIDGWGRDKFMSSSYLLDVNNGFYKDDSVIFCVEICVYGDPENDVMMNPLSSKSDCLLQSLKSLLNDKQSSGKFSYLKYFLKLNMLLISYCCSPPYLFLADILIRCQEKEYYVHKCIICSRSPVFRAMLLGKMAESVKREVVIKDVNPSVLFELLHFLYTDTVYDKDFFQSHVEEMLALGSLYEIRGIVSICEEIYTTKLDITNWLNILQIADTYNFQSLKDKVFQFIGQNTNLISASEVQSLDPDLRKEAEFVINLANARRRSCRNDLLDKRLHVCKLM